MPLTDGVISPSIISYWNMSFQLIEKIKIMNHPSGGISDSLNGLVEYSTRRSYRGKVRLRLPVADFLLNFAR
jgi:hypothetical protein